MPLDSRAIVAPARWRRKHAPVGSDVVFVYRHLPLSVTYCATRLRAYGKRCGVAVTPYQLRHSCATLLLNAGAPILTVQAILGHKRIDTTLRYARLYDATVSSNYHRATEEIQGRMDVGEKPTARAPGTGHLLAPVDALDNGAPANDEHEALLALRAGLQALVERKVYTT
jgi:hypothetical protein